MIGAKVFFIADDKVREGIVTAVTKNYKGKRTYHAAYFGDDGEIYEKFIPENEIYRNLADFLNDIRMQWVARAIEDRNYSEAKKLREIIFKGKP